MNLNNLVIKYDQQKADSREDDILAKHGLKTWIGFELGLGNKCLGFTLTNLDDLIEFLNLVILGGLRLSIQRVFKMKGMWRA